MRLELAVEGWAELGSTEEQGQGEGREMVVIKMVRMEVGRNNKMLTVLINVNNKYLNNTNLILTLSKMPTPEETNIISRYLEEWFYLYYFSHLIHILHLLYIPIFL